MGKRIKRHTEKSLSILCTDMEISYRRKLFPSEKEVLEVKHRICCTACGRNLMNEIKTDLICTHPSLEVIICQECMQFYGDGNYTRDSKGDDIYCRWCAQGGTIYCCSKCSVAFCEKCIKRNLKTDKKVMSSIERDDWACFICQGKPLWYLRALCWAVSKYFKVTPNLRKRKLSDSEEKVKLGPASAKRKPLPGPASKKAKGNDDQTSKKPGPASRTLNKGNEEPPSKTSNKVVDEPKLRPKRESVKSSPAPVKSPVKIEPRQTRQKIIDFKPKVTVAPETKQTKKQPAKKVTFNTKKVNRPKRVAQKKINYTDDDISDDSGSDEELEESGTEIVEDARDPIERAVKNTLDVLFKTSDKFNTKLLKYDIYYKSFNFGEQVNHVCNNLHSDLNKLIQLYTTVDKKMMKYLNEFNEMQEKIEHDKAEVLKELELELSKSLTADIDLDEHGITQEDIEEANAVAPLSDDKEEEESPEDGDKKEKIDRMEVDESSSGTNPTAVGLEGKETDKSIIESEASEVNTNENKLATKDDALKVCDEERRGGGGKEEEVEIADENNVTTDEVSNENKDKELSKDVCLNDSNDTISTFVKDEDTPEENVGGDDVDMSVIDYENSNVTKDVSNGEQESNMEVEENKAEDFKSDVQIDNENGEIDSEEKQPGQLVNDIDKINTGEQCEETSESNKIGDKEADAIGDEPSGDICGKQIDTESDFGNKQTSEPDGSMSNEINDNVTGQPSDSTSNDTDDKLIEKPSNIPSDNIDDKLSETANDSPSASADEKLVNIKSVSPITEIGDENTNEIDNELITGANKASNEKLNRIGEEKQSEELNDEQTDGEVVNNHSEENKTETIASETINNTDKNVSELENGNTETSGVQQNGKTKEGLDDIDGLSDISDKSDVFNEKSGEVKEQRVKEDPTNRYEATTIE